MTKLADIINVPPKRRITIPEGQIAILLPMEIIEDVKEMCFHIRRGRRLDLDQKEAMREIAGDLLLAIIEAIDGQ